MLDEALWLLALARYTLQQEGDVRTVAEGVEASIRALRVALECLRLMRLEPLTF
jgi:hypothetical protein